MCTSQTNESRWMLALATPLVCSANLIQLHLKTWWLARIRRWHELHPTPPCAATGPNRPWMRRMRLPRGGCDAHGEAWQVQSAWKGVGEWRCARRRKMGEEADAWAEAGGRWEKRLTCGPHSQDHSQCWPNLKLVVCNTKRVLPNTSL
jgi:hypothetical protein